MTRRRASRSSFGTRRPGCTPGECALLRSQGGPLPALPFTAVPTCPLKRFDPDIFRVLLLRRRRLPLPLSSHSCRCRPLDCLGYHRASWSRAGVLGRRGFALESAAARACREAGARVSTNIIVRIWTLWQRERRTNDGLKSSLKGCPFSTGLNSRMVNPTDNTATRMGLLWLRCDVAECGPTLHCRWQGSGEAGGSRWEIGGRFSVETQTFIRPLAHSRTAENQGSSVLDAPVGFSLGLRSSPGFRFLVVGASWEARSRWRGTPCSRRVG